MAAGRKGLAAKKKKKKAKHPGAKSADRTVKEGRRRRVEAKGENRRGKNGERQKGPQKKKMTQQTELERRVFLLY